VVVATNTDRAGHTFTARDSNRWQVDLPDSPPPPPPPPPPPGPPPPGAVAPLVVSILGAGSGVERGDPLAKVDNIGRSCGPHLH
jgi:hypothetical protein